MPLAAARRRLSLSFGQAPCAHLRGREDLRVDRWQVAGACSVLIPRTTAASTSNVHAAPSPRSALRRSSSRISPVQRTRCGWPIATCSTTTGTHQRQRYPAAAGPVRPLILRQHAAAIARAGGGSFATQLRRVPSLIPRSRATSAIGLPVSVTIRAPPGRNSASNLRQIWATTPSYRSGLSRRADPAGPPLPAQGASWRRCATPLRGTPDPEALGALRADSRSCPPHPLGSWTPMVRSPR